MALRGPGSRGGVSGANRLSRVPGICDLPFLGGTEGNGIPFVLFFRRFVVSRVFALNVQTQLAKYGQLKPGRFLVTLAGHVLLKFAATAQAAGDWCPSRGWYPVGHGNWTAFTCLDVPGDRNRNCMNVTVRDTDKIIQIGKDGDVSDSDGFFSRCSSSEMLYQLPFPFLEFTFHNIHLYGIGEFPTPKGLICAL